MRIIPHIVYRWRRLVEEMASGNVLYVPKRVAYAARKRFVDLTFSYRYPSRRRACLIHGYSTRSTDLVEHFRSREEPQFHFQASHIDRIVSQIPAELKTSTILQAEEIVRRRFTFRGVGPVVLDPFSWDQAPGNHTEWRRDLNRHFYFTQLGFAYRYTKESRFATTFVDLSSSWIEHNASRLGTVPWDDPFEVAARVNAWIWAHFLFVGCPEWDLVKYEQFLETLGRLSQYLSEVIEYHRPGNHILLEAKALALSSGLFPEFKDSPRWAAKAWSILNHEIREQILSDGVHAEQSTMYHRIVAGELAELMLFCILNKRPEANDLGIVVSKMADFERCITTENGSVPLFGDAYSRDNYIRFSARAIVDALADRDIRRSHNYGVTDESHWAVGALPEGLAKAVVPVCIGGARSKAFPDSGYYVSRSCSPDGTTLLVWDCGTVGHKANHYHSHLDTLSFFLSVDEVPLIIDPGTDEREPQHRRYLCGTSAHNTVRIDGEDQSLRTDDNRIYNPHQPRIIFWGALPECDIMIGTHNGYARLKEPVFHTRTIISMKDRYWLIFDRFEGTGHHTAEQRLHIAPGATVEWTTHGEQLWIQKGRRGLAVVPLSSASESEQATTIESGFAELECGRRESTSVITTTRTESVPFSMATVMFPSASHNPAFSVRGPVTKQPGVFDVIEARGPGFRDEIYLSVVAKSKQEVGHACHTDGRIVILRYGETGVADSAIVADASTFLYGSTEYIHTAGSGGLAKIELPAGERCS